LYFLDTATLHIAKTLKVTDKGKPLKNLNELEYVDGFIYANVWRTDLIARIDAETGFTDGFLDLADVSGQARLINGQSDVLNGIAWHAASKSLVVTGKYWPFMYVLKLQEPPAMQ